MTWLGDHWLDLVGWGGSALLVYSLLQGRVLRFRVLNLVACLVLVLFNLLIEVWPMVAMNLVLCAINVWFIVRLLRDRHDDTAFEVLRVAPDDAYLRHLLKVHGSDIARFQPDFDASADLPGRAAFVVLRGDEAVGVVVVEKQRETAHVLLDYVTRRFRDFSPGEFVWRHSGLLHELGVRHVRTSPRMVGAYYDRVGFRREGDGWVLDVPG
ncbi:MAG: hypothetical protein R2731_16690 [Nocardioides sp.]